MKLVIVAVLLQLLIVCNASAIDVSVKNQPVNVNAGGHIASNEMSVESLCLSTIANRMMDQKFAHNGLIKSSVIGGLLVSNKPCAVLKLLGD